MEYVRILLIAGFMVPIARGVLELGGNEGLALLVSGVLTGLVLRTRLFSTKAPQEPEGAPIVSPTKQPSV